MSRSSAEIIRELLPTLCQSADEFRCEGNLDCDCDRRIATALDAAGARAGAPEGWKLVPVEPTPEMMVAGAEALVAEKGRGHNDPPLYDDHAPVVQEAYREQVSEAYRAMLAAAPPPEGG